MCLSAVTCIADTCVLMPARIFSRCFNSRPIEEERERAEGLWCCSLYRHKGPPPTVRKRGWSAVGGTKSFACRGLSLCGGRRPALCIVVLARGSGNDAKGDRVSKNNTSPFLKTRPKLRLSSSCSGNRTLTKSNPGRSGLFCTVWNPISDFFLGPWPNFPSSSRIQLR